MPAANVIQLQALLAEKFPGLRARVDERSAAKRSFWPTGLPHVDEPLHGGLPRGTLSEIVAAGHGCGSATLIRHLLAQTAHEKRIVALIDGADSFDATRVEEPALQRLLWVRCPSVEAALKAADLVLRDNNLPLVLLDLKSNPEKQLRKIPATTWYRFQYLVEKAATVCAVFTPRPMVAPARTRLTLHPHFSLDALDRDAVELLGELEVETAEAQRWQHSTA